MNKYGARAREHWRTHAPQRYEQIENPERFFTELGREAQGQITDLARQIETNRPLMLAKTRSSRETYLQEVARRMTALRIAEEVVMNQLAWIHDPALPLSEAREEWNQTTANDENLIMWAERMQDSPDLMPATIDLEQKAKDWAVPVWFLEGLVEAEIPRRYLEEHQSVLAEAATIRFLREVR
ncbi:hypothetical protein brsh051_11420 [Brooklawnia propionicigenes]|uniref:Uncharacterized protein n=1 Tax=Brooklawnia propionicigenes TaxID=3041175 RepID=A0AAN0K6H3_9ACTN|nr:hypothetical protein [Brooklawnia sp. SH051]BEH01861.1 hypothetical protein brsh051_11420 [Brooklawnia sp. SH051]